MKKLVLVTVLAAVVSSCIPHAKSVHSARRSRAAAVEEATSARATRGLYASSPVTIDGVLAYPPASDLRSPSTVIYLHGARGRADKGCPFMRVGAREVGWLVCPEALSPAANETFSWGADPLAQAPVVKSALAVARARGASSEPGVAVGFSQGSYVALDLVKAKLATFRGLVLLGAELHPNVARLREAGVERVALGAGRLDGAGPSLKEEAERMSSEGLPARFFDLGDVGHTYAAEDSETLREAIRWAAGSRGAGDG